MRNSAIIKSSLGSFFFCLFSLFSIGYEKKLAAATAEVTAEPERGLALHVWDRYIRKFRRDHNLSLSIGYYTANWEVGRFGDLTDRKYSTTPTGITSEYTFHILIAGKTGYFLGTSMGYLYERTEEKSGEFQATSSWLFPGVVAGIVYNYDPSGRFFAGGSAQLERFDHLRTKKQNGEWQEMSITGQTFSLFFGVDLFFSLDAAIHIAWFQTSTYIPRPADASDFLVNTSIEKKSQGGQLGIVYHFL